MPSWARCTITWGLTLDITVVVQHRMTLIMAWVETPIFFPFKIHTTEGQMCPQGRRASHGRTQPPLGAWRGISPGWDINLACSGCLGQIIGKAGPIWSLTSISSRIVDHVVFWRKFAAFPNIYRPCLARDSATFIRFGLCNIIREGYIRKKVKLTLRKPIDADPVSIWPEFLTSETITILASWPWKMSTVPRRIYQILSTCTSPSVLT